MKKSLVLFFSFACLGLCTTTLAQNINTANFTSLSNSAKAAAINVTLTGTLSTNGNSDFKQMRDLGYQIKTITLTNASCTAIPKNALVSQHSLQSLSLPENTVTVGSQAFRYCDALTTLHRLPRSVKSLGYAAFANCKQLQTLAFEEQSNLVNMGSYCFANDSALSGAIIIPSGVRLMRMGVFYGCPNISAVTLPTDLQGIEAQAFAGCRSLTSIHLGNLIADIGASAFEGCTALTGLTMPRAVQRIQSCAFRGCGITGSLVLPESLTELGTGAFENCTNITSIVLNSSNYSIPTKAFAGCTGVETIRLAAINPPKADATAFMGMNVANVTLEIPAESEQAYRTAEVWKNFKLKAYTLPTGIKKNDCTTACSVTLVGSNIVVTSIPQGCSAKVYNTEGRLIGKSSAKSTNATMALHEHGTYIVTVDEKEYKIVY